jgi:hypothetical protein
MATAQPVQPSEETQPTLFLADQLPDLPDVVLAAKEFSHTGKIVCKNGERAEAILVHYLRTGSLRCTAKHMGCSPHTVLSVLNHFESAGKLDAYKQRLSHKLGLALELGADDMVERLTKGTLHLSPIDQAVLIDKKLLLDGDPTQRVAVEVTHKIEADDVLAYLRSRGLPLPAIDVKSTANPEEPKQ